MKIMNKLEAGASDGILANATDIYDITRSQSLQDTVDNLVAESGGIQEETDPIFSASPAANITEAMNAWILAAMEDTITTDDLDEICI